MSLAVCTVLENHLGWKSRYRNFYAFKRFMLKEYNIKLYAAEVVLGDREFKLNFRKSADPITYLELRTNSEIWHKENALNLLTQQVKEDAIAYVDADIIFTNPDWVSDTLKQLEHYDVVQMFSYIQNLNSVMEPIGLPREGYFFQYKRDGKITGDIIFKKNPRIPEHKIAPPGGAMAFRRETLSKLGGLIDWCIMGGADFHMSAALLSGLHPDGALSDQGFTDDYNKLCENWQDRADKYVKRNIGYVPGLAIHYWHGNANKRKYLRNKTPLKTYHFTPTYDLVRNTQGVYELIDRSIDLRDTIKEYLRSRDEDQLDERIIA